MKDEDGDGWGDSSVAPGVDGGADCYDTNADLNPGDSVLFTAIDASGDIASVDVATGQIDVFATVDIAPLQGMYQVISNAISPVDGRVYGSQSAKQRLVRYDYCDGGTPTELAHHGKSICGLEFDPVSKQVFTTNADELFQISIDGSDQYDTLPMLSESINDLTFGPTC